MKTLKDLKDNPSKYAIYCCNVLYSVRHKKFKRCRRCGKILKDERDDISNTTDKA